MASAQLISRFAGSRASRAGKFRLDVFFMIIVIIWLVANVIMAIVAFDKYNKDEQYVARMEDLANIHLAEWETSHESARRACEPLGFRPVDGGPSSVQTMYDVFEAASRDILSYTEGREELERATPETGPTLSRTGELTGFEMKELPRPAFSSVDSSMLKLIAFQDLQINFLIGVIERTAKVRKMELGAANDAVKKREEASVQKNKKLIDDTTSRDAGLKADGIGQENSENVETASSKSTFEKLNTAYDTLIAAQKQVDVIRPTIWDPIVEANIKRMKALNILVNRIGTNANSGDFDGHIVQVDTTSGWCWLSVGQPQNVRNEMSFQVLRPTPNKVSYQLIGEVRVKAILEGGVSRARVDAVESADNMPAVGDLLRNANYSRDQYRVYSFLGKFGQPHTRYTKEQLKDTLYRFNKEVLEAPEDRVEVIILGGDWLLDPKLEALLTDMKFETMTEQDLLYMFGIAGPDPN